MSPNPTSVATPTERAGRWLVWPIAIALLSSAWLFDPFAQAAFDAPKQRIALIAAVAAALMLIWRTAPSEGRRWSRPAQRILGCLLIGGVGVATATCAATNPASAFATLPVLALYALFLPLGAARWLDDGAIGLYGVAAIAIALNALLSLLQAAGVMLPIPMALPGGRFPTGALLGNEGYVALACALMAAACLAFALNATARRPRVLATSLCVLAIATIAINRQLTSALALVAAIVVIAAVRWRARWIIAIGAGLVMLAAASVWIPAIRSVTWSALPVGGVEGYQKLTTYRLGAWAAASGMIGERPWLGHGPGSYAEQSQHYRLDAEIQVRARLTPPPTANAFVYAHQDYLQLAAETGMITLLALLTALGALINALLRLARSPGSTEPLALLGVIVAGAIAALAWFPLQIPFTAALLLLACGRAWRLIADDGARPHAITAGAPRPKHHAMKHSARILLSLLLLGLLWPQLASYRAEWKLAQASTRLDRVLRGLDQGAAGFKSVDEARALAHHSARLLPSDPRPPLLESIALILRGEGEAAVTVLDAALARGERPELTLNLGRARSTLGDAAGSDAAYLRTAWASPAAIATLPKAMRDDLQARVSRLETALRAGQLKAPPPL